MKKIYFKVKSNGTVQYLGKMKPTKGYLITDIPHHISRYVVEDFLNATLIIPDADNDFASLGEGIVTIPFSLLGIGRIVRIARNTEKVEV
jgi:hypothetical protein